MIRLGTILVDEEGYLHPANPKSFMQNVPSSNPENYSEQYFCEQTVAYSPEVQLDTQSLDFGSCSKMRVIDPMTLRVSNRSRGKMICQWITPPSK